VEPVARDRDLVCLPQDRQRSLHVLEGGPGRRLHDDGDASWHEPGQSFGLTSMAADDELATAVVDQCPESDINSPALNSAEPPPIARHQHDDGHDGCLPDAPLLVADDGRRSVAADPALLIVIADSVRRQPGVPTSSLRQLLRAYRYLVGNHER
jgi:hypothetical protein